VRRRPGLNFLTYTKEGGVWIESAAQAYHGTNALEEVHEKKMPPRSSNFVWATQKGSGTCGITFLSGEGTAGKKVLKSLYCSGGRKKNELTHYKSKQKKKAGDHVEKRT